jgi:hypothetical protein
MKNSKHHHSLRKLNLNCETIRLLSAEQLVEVGGGSLGNVSAGNCGTTVCTGIQAGCGGGGHTIM